MYFPNDMTFQYFFFDTYIGYFLQALPIALAVSIIYYFIKFKKDSKATLSKKIYSCIFVCYVTGIICLTIGLDLMNAFWYRLIYHMDSGNYINWLGGDFNFELRFINNINSETVGNFIMFLLFGILYYLSREKVTFKRCILSGTLFVFTIEILQPIFGRAFDVNDIILNVLGIFISTLIVVVIRKIKNIN